MSAPALCPLCGDSLRLSRFRHRRRDRCMTGHFERWTVVAANATGGGTGRAGVAHRLGQSPGGDDE